MRRPITAGSTNQTIDIFIQDSSSTVGAGLGSLVYNSSGLTCYYRKGATGTATALTLATQTVGGAHSDGGFVEIDTTNMPGLYRLDLSDAMVDTAGQLIVYLKGASNMAPVIIEIPVSFPSQNTDKSGYSISGTKTTLDALNDISEAQVNAQCDTAISDASLATAASIAALNDVSVSDILTTAMTEAYNSDGSTMTVAQALYLITQVLTESSITGTTMTVKKLDGTTTAMTITLDDATTPTSITRAS